MLTPWKKSYDQPRRHIQKQRHYFANKGPSSQGYGFFQWSCMDVRVGLWRKLSAEELMLLNCSVLEDSWESLGPQGDPTIHSEGDQLWDFFGGNVAEAETPVLWPPHCKELTHWKRLWCWEGLGEGGKGDDRGDGWIASQNRWTWVWVNSGRWWWTGRPGTLRFTGAQRVGRDWVTELNRTELKISCFYRQVRFTKFPLLVKTM